MSKPTVSFIITLEKRGTLVGKTELDYFGLRFIFERNGNREKSDRLVLQFINKLNSDFIRKEEFPRFDFIEDFELQKKTIDRLTVIQTYLLIRLKAQPRDLLLAHLFHSEEAQIEFSTLYKNGKINIKEFFTEIFGKMPLNQRIDYLYKNYGYLALFLEAKENIRSLQYFGYEVYEVFEIAVKEFLEFIIKNGYPHLSLAMDLIPLLYENRLEIINGWIEEEKALELDVYALPLIEDTILQSQDDMYIEKLQKRGHIGPEQPLTITPVSGDDKQ